VTLTGSLRIVLSESQQQLQVRDAIESQSAETEEDTILAVGPEGGWTSDELQGFQQAGWISASLGTTILRAETAAIAATAIIISALR
jgi:16S rRNA (uracil1498-N3)-methyltransferase